MISDKSTCIKFEQFANDTIASKLFMEPIIKSVFESLVSKFGNKYEIWMTHSDFQRNVYASVKRPLGTTKDIAISIKIVPDNLGLKSGIKPELFQKMHDYLLSDADKDLVIE